MGKARASYCSLAARSKALIRCPKTLRSIFNNRESDAAVQDDLSHQNPHIVHKDSQE